MWAVLCWPMLVAPALASGTGERHVFGWIVPSVLGLEPQMLRGDVIGRRGDFSFRQARKVGLEVKRKSPAVGLSGHLPEAEAAGGSRGGLVLMDTAGFPRSLLKGAVAQVSSQAWVWLCLFPLVSSAPQGPPRFPLALSAGVPQWRLLSGSPVTPSQAVGRMGQVTRPDIPNLVL